MRVFLRILFPVSLCLITPQAAICQDTIVLNENFRWDSANSITNCAGFYVSAKDGEDISAITEKSFSSLKGKYGEIHKKYRRTPVTIWIKWLIHNPGNDGKDVLFVFHRNTFMTAYYQDRQGIKLLKKRAPFFLPETKESRRQFSFTVPPGETATIFVALKDIHVTLYAGYPIMMGPVEYQNMMQSHLYKNRYAVFLNIVFLAVIFFIILHTLAQYFFNRRREFLYYAFYASCVLILFVYKLDTTWYSDIFFSNFPYIQKYANTTLTYLVFFSYFRFIRQFINFKSIAGWFYKVLVIIEHTLLAVCLLDILVTGLDLLHIRTLMFNTARISLITISVIGLYLLIKTRDRLNLIIAIGSGSFVTGGLAALLHAWLIYRPNVMEFDGMKYMQIGIVFELICFTMGLSYKTSLIEREKKATQQQLIGELEKNEKLQSELNTRLEMRVKEQTDRIVAQQKQLEVEKEQQLILTFTQKITEMELQLLKSQLNPHFYFNTLNNLYGLAMIAPKKAPGAILMLSDIMEYVIYDCRNDKVPLEKELKFIKSYVELEKLRYDNSVSIQYQADSNTNGNLISPLLLIQFIENAFKHGLEESKNNCYLRINIRIRKNELFYESINSARTGLSNRRGLGLANVKKRLEIIYPLKHHLEILSDKYAYKVSLHLELS